MTTITATASSEMDGDLICDHVLSTPVSKATHDGDKMAVRASQFAIRLKWFQGGNYEESVCDNTMKITKRLLFVAVYSQSFTSQT